MSMKKELGDCTSRFNLCVRSSIAGVGLSRSTGILDGLFAAGIRKITRHVRLLVVAMLGAGGCLGGCRFLQGRCLGRCSFYTRHPKGIVEGFATPCSLFPLALASLDFPI